MTKWDTSDPNRYRGVPRALADRIRARDHHTCQSCGAPGHEVDHIVNVKAGGTNNPENLQTLCRTCHWRKTRAEGLAARRARSNTRPPERSPGLL